MAIIAVSSLKGGVGKTTTSLHLAHAFAHHGHQTLLIDGDGSAHASRFFGIERRSSEPGLVSLLKPPHDLGPSATEDRISFASVPSDTIAFEVRKNLDLIPANHSKLISPDDLPLPKDIVQGVLGGDLREFYLSQVLNILKQSYRHIVIDTAPEFNIVTKNALKAADCVIIPVDPGAMAISSLDDLIKVGSTPWSCKTFCILRTMVNRRASRTNSLSLEALSGTVSVSLDLSGKGSNTGYGKMARVGVLESVIGRTEVAHQLSYAHRTAFDVSYAPSLAEDYERLFLEIMGLTQTAGVNVVGSQDLSAETSSKMV